SGSGAKYNTSVGNLRIDPSENRIGAKRLKHWRRSRSTISSTSSSGLNGYNKVTCAGMPLAADGSYRSRNGFTKSSASGTRMTNAVMGGQLPWKAAGVWDLYNASTLRHSRKSVVGRGFSGL